MNCVAGSAKRSSVALPSGEELRMVRAIALSSVGEALKRGQSHAFFRRFRIDAARLQSAYDCCFAKVELVVRLDGHIIDRQLADIQQLHFV